MRVCMLIAVAILGVGCASATPPLELTQPLTSPTATSLPIVEPVELSFLNSLDENDILIQYSLSPGLTSSWALYNPPRFILYADGRVIFSRQDQSTIPTGLYETKLSKGQVLELMTRLHSFGKAYLKGYGYNDCPVCPTDGHMDVLKVLWTAQDFHIAEAYWSEVPEYSKLPAALAVLQEYTSRDADLYVPTSATLYVTEGFHEYGASVWTSDTSLLSIDDDCPLKRLDAAQTLSMIEQFGTNIGEENFERNEDYYWVSFIPNVPSIDYEYWC